MTELTERLERGAQLETPGQAEPPSARAVSMWRIFFVGVILLFIVLLAVGLWKTIKDGQRAAGEAPELSFATFDGEEVVLRDLRGKGVVVNFWASWCAPCREEAALLEQTWRREKENGIVFLGLDYLDQEPAALAYLAEFDVTYPNGPDLRSRAARRYRIQGVPETFFISPEGKIVDIVVGPIAGQQELDALLDRIRPP
ncbi:MAG: TlpA disulfide reductase family protein [Caldilineaceae bacterium]|nr:TlpA disulfide reductase family protein [Caldilineaceae bacterium]MCY4090509.1 TlpA disulfide reductase family protein [Caldilineaceae bacterium]MCY4117735.1 TlpA disulfide reductase family protein [Caldilineaceae bacterium]MDE0071388.1 TlpA disulfide reductase family protein [Caldilineaceae bacterium]MDE0183613.1 TlpA disulfide reductase family protein [Caldilineaceae bacterium]